MYRKEREKQTQLRVDITMNLQKQHLYLTLTVTTVDFLTNQSTSLKALMPDDTINADDTLVIHTGDTHYQCYKWTCDNTYKRSCKIQQRSTTVYNIDNNSMGVCVVCVYVCACCM